MFDTWVLNRGQEWDQWISPLDPVDIPDHYGRIVPQYWYNRREFADAEEHYPSPMTIAQAADWLETHHERDNFLLWIETFDPHEPFDVPQKYLDMVGDDYDGKLYLWPEYKPVDQCDLTPEAMEHVRRRYLALMLMTDHWMGRVFDVMDRHDMWKDTAFFFTTDHGFMFGEHGHQSKNYMPAYNEVFHIPLIVHLPGDEGAGKRIDALTQNIDIMPTLLGLYGIDPGVCRNPMHGKSWLPLIRGDVKSLRDCALYGIFGKQMNITDGRYTYFKSPTAKNRPLNLYTSMPTDVRVYFDCDRISDFSQVTAGPYLGWTDFPVYCIPADATRNKSSALRFYCLHEWEMVDQLYDLQTDYAQENNLCAAKPELVYMMNALMRSAMAAHDAPAEQYERLMLRP
jgi:arylsulfatase A-like enzyme